MAHPTACCQHHSQQPSVHQTLEEMEFERGLWSAALSGETERVEQLLRDGRNPNAVDSSGYTPLIQNLFQHYAARNGHLSICENLLRHSACVNASTRSGRVTPLHRAAYCNHGQIVRLLLTYGAQVDAADSDQKTALHKACERGNLQVVKLLLSHAQDKGISITDYKDSRDKKPVDCVKSTDKEIIELLDKTVK